MTVTASGVDVRVRRRARASVGRARARWRDARGWRRKEVAVGRLDVRTRASGDARGRIARESVGVDEGGWMKESAARWSRWGWDGGAVVGAAAGAAAVGVASAGAANAATMSMGGWDAQTWAIGALFFLAGVGLEIGTVREAAADWRLNALIEFFIFVFPPCVVAAAGPVLVRSGWLDEGVVDGLFVMACLPTTVGSGVAFTRSAGGDVPTALLNSMAANLVGIFLTPALIHAYLGAESTIDPVASSSKLLTQAFVPVVLGMSLRLAPGVASAADGALKEPSKIASDAILLAIVVKTFVTAEQSEAGALDWTSAGHLVSVLAAFMLLHKGSIWLATSSASTFSRPGRVAALYMGSHKTLAFGLPLITTTFGDDPNLTSYLLPLVVYHPALLVASSALAAPLRAYVDDAESERET